jgi:hypothetical protein
MMVGLKRISTAVGLLAATVAASDARGRAPSTNQATADAVAGALSSSQALSGYRIEIETRDGLVTLTGSVATRAQKAEAITRARSVPGVSAVADMIQVVVTDGVRPAQYEPQTRTRLAMGHQWFGGAGGPVPGGEVIYDGTPAVTQPMGAVGPAGAVPEGPLPEGPAIAPGAVGITKPAFPNYAWPSYAPYPNYSAVGYPTVYPWQAWPNIGPPYPYPEVPLDWRAVTLRWDDGIWWLDFKKNYTRPFFTPYPFGIFAY